MAERAYGLCKIYIERRRNPGQATRIRVPHGTDEQCAGDDDDSGEQAALLLVRYASG